MKQKLVIYTCVTGGYDQIKPLVKKNSYFDCFYFTDSAISESQAKGWKIFPIEPQGNPKEQNRYYKILPHRIPEIADYEYSLYIDGSINIVGELEQWSRTVLESEQAMALYSHSKRSSVPEEIISVAQRNQAPLRELEDFVGRLQVNQWIGCNQLFDCSLLLRNTHNEEIVKVMETWWKFFLEGPKRDQLHFPRACAQNNFSPRALAANGRRLDERYFVVGEHFNDNRWHRFWIKNIYRPYVRHCWADKIKLLKGVRGGRSEHGS
jgi:hypothetical protein